MTQNTTGVSDTKRLPYVGSIIELEKEMGEGVERHRFAGLGSNLGLTKFGVNHETIFPGGRSSKPHAHSEEEEFVLVLEGQPSLWVDGEVLELAEGEAVAFPAGTGIAHTFINNSRAPIKLLIIGERSASDQVNYPIDQDALHPRPWKNAPARSLGPHNGRPDV
ncbi:MAG: cupin domain-containing protein [Myxococcales bacterium]